MKRMAIVVFMLALVGCGINPAVIDNAGARLTVKATTLKYIDKPDDWQERSMRAARVAAVVEKAIEMLDGGLKSTIPMIEIEIREAIDWSKLDSAETLLVDELIAYIKAELESRVNGGTVTNDLIVLREMLTWVLDAARMAGARYD